jgi:glycosyltransferase involved in cell wall biosynthesis
MNSKAKLEILHIAYFTIEDIGSGLFQTQILDILTEIIKQDPKIKFEIIAVNRAWHFSAHRRCLRKIAEKFPINQIKVRYIPLLPPLRNALKSYLYSVFVTKWLTLIYWTFGTKKARIVHCRSYWPTEAAINSGTTPVVFDMRSLWPLESMSIGDLMENSRSQKYWLNLEKNCLQKASISTGVSMGMIDYAKLIVPGKRYDLIPISADLEKFKFNITDRLVKRKILSWTDDLILVYSGGFGQSGANHGALRWLFKLLLGSDSSIKLLFLTMETDEAVKELMSGVINSNDRYQIIHPAFNEMSGWLSVADIGVHALPLQLDSATRLGTKVVEYWTNGLPVIVNENVGAAAEFIKKFNVGLVLNSTKDVHEGDWLIQQIKSLTKLERQHQTDFATKHFSSITVAKKYLNTYRYCLGDQPIS